MSDGTFGLSDEARFYIDTAAEKAATEAVRLAFANRACPRDCERVSDLEAATYGNGTGGLKHRVTVLETQMEDVVWAKRASLAAAIAAAGSLIVSLWR